jgi:hypothetical protein
MFLTFRLDACIEIALLDRRSCPGRMRIAPDVGIERDAIRGVM